MKKIITMVGTSMLGRYLNDNKNDREFKNYLEKLHGDTSQYFHEEDRVNKIKKKLNDWIKNKNSDELVEISAEVKSITKISERIKENLDIYLLTSDTILSNLIFEVLSNNWEKFPKIGSFNLFPNSYEGATIKGLQTSNWQDFSKEGMPNLIKKIFGITGGYWGGVIINITSGYKATIPYLTILGQVNKCPIYYIFENTDELIEIPIVPLDIDWKIFEENEEFLFNLERESVSKIKKDVYIPPEIENLLEKAGSTLSLNTLGEILWERYKQKFDFFKIFEAYWDEFQKLDNRRKKIVEEHIKKLKEKCLLENTDNYVGDLHHDVNIKLPKGFSISKDTQNSEQVRVLYKPEKYNTSYGSQDIVIYIAYVFVGNDVHNAGNEYVEKLKKFLSQFNEQLSNDSKYKIYRIERTK